MKHKAEDYGVLFIMCDQHKRSATGCYGHPLVQTPHIDRLAREGLLFASAYCQSPLCGPSRSSVMTATHCHTCRGLTQTQPVPIRDVPTLGSVFRDAGYVTASIGKVHIRGEQPPRRLQPRQQAHRDGRAADVRRPGGAAVHPLHGAPQG